MINEKFEELATHRNGYSARDEKFKVHFIDRPKQGRLFGEEPFHEQAYSLELAVRWMVPHEAYDLLTEQIRRQGTAQPVR